MTIIHAARRVLSASLCVLACSVSLTCQGQVLLGPLPPIGSSDQTAVSRPPEPGEPPRWTQEDVTPEQKLATAQKEARAAYQVQLDICKIMHPSERPGCIAQARADFQQEMADIGARFGVLR